MVKNCFQIFDRFLIPIDSWWKNIFDSILIISSVYNVYVNAFYSAFRLPEGDAEVVLDKFIEYMFLLDMIFCFFQEFKDGETFVRVTGFKVVAMRYAKKSFVFDLVAWLPVDEFFTFGKHHGNDSNAHLFRILKLLRIPRLFELLDVEKFKGITNMFYQAQLDKAVAKDDFSYHYPILQQLKLVYIYRLLQIILIIISCSYFLAIFWRIYVHDIIDYDH